MECVECSTSGCKESIRRCEAGYGCFSSFKEKQLMKGCIANNYHYKIICTNTAHPVICCKEDLCNLNVTQPFSDKQPSKFKNKVISMNPFTPKSDLIDFTLSDARRFYSSKGDPLGVKGLKNYLC